MALKDLQEAREQSAERAMGPSIECRREELEVFYEKYEDLVEVLCIAGNYGPDSKLDHRYGQIRSWMQEHYPPLRLFVVAYLRFDSRDAQAGLDWHGLAGDAFEALFAAPSLDEFLRLDDGQMIWRIERTRDALNLYGEHLRQLAAQERECA